MLLKKIHRLAIYSSLCLLLFFWIVFTLFSKLLERVHFAFLQRSQHQQQHGDGKHTRTNESGSSSNWGSKCFNSTNEVQRGVIRKCLKLAILIWTRDGGTGWEGKGAQSLVERVRSQGTPGKPERYLVLQDPRECMEGLKIHVIQRVVTHIRTIHWSIVPESIVFQVSGHASNLENISWNWTMGDLSHSQLTPF